MTREQENTLPTRQQRGDMPCLDDIININEEIRQLEEKLEAEPANDEILAHLSDLYKEKNDPSKNNHLQKAKECALAALGYNPENVIALTNLGYFACLRDIEWYGYNHKSLRADFYLRRAIRVSKRKDINDREAYHIAFLARCLGHENIFDEYLTLTLQKNQQNPDARLNRAIWFMPQEKAEDILIKNLQDNPSHLGSVDRLSYILFEKGEKDKSQDLKVYATEIAKRRGLTDRLFLFC